MIAQAVNMMNYLKRPKQFKIPIYQRIYASVNYKVHTDAIKDKLIPSRHTKEMIDSNALMDSSARPDFCTSALFYTQSFEKREINEFSTV